MNIIIHGQYFVGMDYRSSDGSRRKAAADLNDILLQES